MPSVLEAGSLALACSIALACTSQPAASEQRDAAKGAAERRSWPQAAGEPLDEATPLSVSITPRALSLGERELLRLRAGGLDARDVTDGSIHALAEALADAPSLARPRGTPHGIHEPQVLVYADARTPFATLIDVVTTLRAARVSRYAFAVEPTLGVSAQIPARMPQLRVAQLPRSVSPDAPLSEALAQREAAQARLDALVMTIELRGDRTSMSIGRNATAPPVEVARDDLDAVTRYAQDLRASSPLSRQVLISAAPELPCQALLETMAAARGPDCGAPEGACTLPEVILFKHSAHARGPKGKTSLPPLPSG